MKHHHHLATFRIFSDPSSLRRSGFISREIAKACPCRLVLRCLLEADCGFVSGSLRSRRCRGYHGSAILRRVIVRSGQLVCQLYSFISCSARSFQIFVIIASISLVGNSLTEILKILWILILTTATYRCAFGGGHLFIAATIAIEVYFPQFLDQILNLLLGLCRLFLRTV